MDTAPRIEAGPADLRSKVSLLHKLSTRVDKLVDGPDGPFAEFVDNRVDPSDGPPVP